MREINLTVDTGDVVIPLKDAFGDVFGKIKFNPNDLDIIKRFDGVTKYIDGMQSKIEGKEDITEDEIISLSDEIKEQIDYLFNAPVAKEFFKRANPFTPLDNGNPYVYEVMDAVGRIMNAIATDRAKATNDRMKEVAKKHHE